MLSRDEVIGALGPDLLGDQINFYNGSLSFSHTDASIPGNNALPVTIGRNYTVTESRATYDNPFADWTIDLPHIRGVFSTNHGWVSTNPNGDRCSVATLLEARPPNVHLGEQTVFPYEYWHGNQISIPGRGSQEMLIDDQPIPSSNRPSGTWYWVTSDWTWIGCLPSTVNGVGQGFTALTPDGTTYRFDWFATHQESTLEVPYPAGIWGDQPGHGLVERRQFALYATYVEDRFDNWVKYSYEDSGAGPVRPKKIESSDGRVLDFTYNTNNHVSKVVEGTREWNYQYSYANSNKPTLTQVTRPDGSKWQINFAGFNNLAIHYVIQQAGEPWRDCLNPPAVQPSAGVGTVTHPSGAMGSFDVKPRLFGRSNVEKHCINDTGPGSLNDKNDDYSAYPVKFYSTALMKKTLTGPGLQSATWNYDYGGTFHFAPLVGTSWTEVTGPGGEYIKLTFGNEFKSNEGLLLQTEEGSGSATRTTTNTYHLTPPPSSFPARIGRSPQIRGDNHTAEALRPQASRVISQGGTAFNWNAISFDGFGRVTSAVKSGPAGTKTELTQFRDDASPWVLGQIAKVTVDSIDVSETTFYGATALPHKQYSYGALQYTLDYHPDGTLKSAKDSRNPATLLTNWYRGIPRNIQYSDGTTVSADVNAYGEITRTVDAMSFEHNYQYDAMGRLARIDYPAATGPSWAPTILNFDQVASSEYGLPATHWRQTVTTGAYSKATYFDALWRPVLTRERDSNPAVPNRYIARSFDVQGRETFASYPLESVASWSAPADGVAKSYDALGRITSMAQRGGSGNLVTEFTYPSGNSKTVKDPRNHSTTYTYQAYGEPSDSNPTSIAAPEGQITSIGRDVLGKPKTITRAGLTRSYVYDANQRLCKRVDPEAGATIVAYDVGGNIDWTTSGSSLMDTSSCDRLSVAAGEKSYFAYDNRNRVTSVAHPGGAASIGYSYNGNGALSTIDSGNSVWAYYYNDRGLLVSETLNHNADIYVFGLGYDAIGNIVSRTMPGYHTLEYAPNAFGQPTQAVSASDAYATGAKYFPDGSLKEVTLGNGIVRTFTKNAFNLPSTSVDAHGGTTFRNLGYDYDAAGNLVEIYDYAQQGLLRQSMAYDALNRLTHANAPNMWGNASYLYDGADNIREATVGSKQAVYAYDSDGQLTAISGSGGAPTWTFGYDVRGNQTSRTGTSSQARVFDAANRLVSISGIASYSYDGHGRRTQTNRDGGSHQVSMYTLDGVLRQQRDSADDTGNTYIHLGGTLVARVEESTSPPPTPVLTAPAISTPGSLAFSWTSATDARVYRFEYLDGSTWREVDTVSTLGHAYTITIPGNYQHRVKACNLGGCSASAPKGTIVVATPTLNDMPTNYTGSYTVSWGAVPGATSYVLHETSPGAGSWSVTGPSKTISDKGVGSYQYRVQACIGPCGNLSTAKTVVVSVPLVPGYLTVPDTSYTGSFTVTWNSSIGSTYFQLQRRKNTGSWATIHDGSTRQVSQSGLATGNYGYRVRGCSSVGCSAFSSIVVAKVTRKPTHAPTISGPSSVLNNLGYTISWNTVTDGHTYTLQRRLNGGAWSTIQDTSAVTRSEPVGMPAGNNEYRVRAANVAGYGPWSSTKSVQVSQYSGGGHCSTTPPYVCNDPQGQPDDPPEQW